MKGIYLDHAASAPLLPEVAEAMLDAMRGGPGNPSSLHAFGRAARARLTDARDRIAAVLNCKPSEIVFTSGGTESDNAAVIGAARALRRRGKTHVVVSAIEHHAVLHAADALEREGFAVTRVLPDATGWIDPAAVEEALRPETGLVSVMWANNEVGTIQPVHAIGARLAARGIVFHVDAVQALGAVPIDMKETPAGLVSFSAHKLGGPHGIGALYIASGTPFEPIIHEAPGRNGERGRRLRIRARGRARGRKPGGEGPAPCGAPGQARGALDRPPRTGRGHRERPHRQPAAASDEHQLHRRGHGDAAHGARPRGDRGGERLGLFVGFTRAVARAEGDGAAGGAPEVGRPFQFRPVEHVGRNRDSRRKNCNHCGSTA